MSMTRAQINAKSDAKRGVRVQSYKLHENTIARLAELSQQTGQSKTTIVAKGIDKMTEIQVTISNLCKYSHFYADEYAAFLYDAIIDKYPNAKITFILSNECNTNIIPEIPYIRGINSEGNVLEDIENICQKTCDLLIEKCKDRRLHSSPTPEPSIYPNEPKIEKIWHYLEGKGVNMFTLGW
ncbi:hypothetical protein [Aggregatibacter sp. Marseille-P9115]|uniref:hypothetical protein n=1 Tax=Aggregatibacter sp. Marseille-P9115 TaxID=2866570 RepID=UPI001E3FC7DC|nr:hypothetical protein [Aggregatibacter sp. Marseille-P9115]DAS42236.1 MAG TPA: hypothetical protein [Caudoviricetes sp.]DAU02270.1 MAG TPA: hypothetical protein [Caudoviricetes sp.]